jgi:DNA processing protein
MAQLRYWLWLSTLPGLTLRGQRNVLQHFGSPEEAFLSDDAAAAKVEGLTGREQAALRQKDLGLADSVLEDCRKRGIGLMTYQDAMYPQRLKNIDTPPLVLYYRGTVLPFDELPVVAVVGSRKASGYGLTTAKRMGYQLGASGGTVLSGAARGIDSLALEGALSAGASVAAVLGNGLDIVYPPEAGRLYEDIEKNGCLLSEFPPGTPPYGRNFPQRNRLISGLSLGVLVVEASRRSGSLITANLALEQGRDVFAVPGNIGLEVCAGSNALLQEGAMLASCGWDILREYAALYPDKLHRRGGGDKLTLSPRDRETATLKPESGETDKNPVKSPEIQKNTPLSDENRIDNGQNRNYIDLQQIKSALSPDEQAIVSVLAQGQRHVDDVIDETGLTPARVLSSLTLLEVKGYVTQQPGKRFDLNIN